LTGATDAVVVNEGGHGFYRVRYSRDLLDRLVRRLPGGLAPIERFNLLGDAWAATVAGLMPIEEYLDLTAEFRGERDKNVWVILTGSLHTLNRIILPGDRPGLERLVRDRIAGAVEELGWAPRPDEDELRRQLRGDLIRARHARQRSGDPGTGRRAVRVSARRDHRGSNVLPSLIRSWPTWATPLATTSSTERSGRQPRPRTSSATSTRSRASGRARSSSGRWP
jgi:puromycin-sensitive aminopeptidase